MRDYIFYICDKTRRCAGSASCNREQCIRTEDLKHAKYWDHIPNEKELIDNFIVTGCVNGVRYWEEKG